MNIFEGIDLICFSHLRWNFVFQRPQHLMIRIARTNRVFFFEEPVFDDEMHYDVTKNPKGIFIIVPHLSSAMSAEEIQDHQREFLSRFLINMNIRQYALWYFTAMALPVGENLNRVLRIYDCMD